MPLFKSDRPKVFGQTRQAGSSPRTALVQQYAKPLEQMTWSGFQHGLNSSVHSSQIVQTECAELLNFKINKGGRLETRPAMVQVNGTSAVTGEITRIRRVVIGGTTYTLIADTDSKLYYLDGSDNIVLIGQLNTTAAGDIHITSYKDVALVSDGSYLKYVDTITPAQTDIKMAYSDTEFKAVGHQVFNGDAVDVGYDAVGDGTTSRVAVKFTTDTWPASPTVTLKPTAATAYLTMVGNGFTGTDNVDVMIRIRKVSDDSVSAEAVLVEAPINGKLSPTTPASFTGDFLTGTINAELLSNTDYYASVEYANGDGTNHVAVRGATPGTTGTDGTGYAYAGSWATPTGNTLTPKISARPGLPPVADMITVHNLRPWVVGNTEPGRVYFGALTYLDWGKDGSGGRVGAVDTDPNTYAIGGMASLFGELWFFGKKEQPYLAKLTGASPTEFAVQQQYQRVWADQDNIAVTQNDIWFTSEAGVDAISGVQEFGDLRTYSYSDPINDRIVKYFTSTNTFGEYYSVDGQYIISSPDYRRSLVVHTKIPVQDPYGVGIRYPWTEYEFMRDDLSNTSYFKWTLSDNGTNEYFLEAAAGGDPGVLEPDFMTKDDINLASGTPGSLSQWGFGFGDNDTLGYSTIYYRDDDGDPDTYGVKLRSVMRPTAFGEIDNELFIGSTCGNVYKLTTQEYKELDKYGINFQLRTSYIQSPFNPLNVLGAFLSAFSLTGAEVAMYFHVNFNLFEYEDSTVYSLPLSDSLLIDNMTMDIDDAIFSIDPSNFVVADDNINFNGYSVNVKLKDIKLVGNPLFINGVVLKYKQYLLT